jgi:uncharacterized protein (DUF433 family)
VSEIELDPGVVSDPQIMDGLPVIRDTRIPVYLIIEMFEAGLTIDGILSEFPHLSADQVRAALHYACDRVAHR